MIREKGEKQGGTDTAFFERMKAKNLEEWDNIKNAFFKIDEEKKIAKVVLQYESTEDLIDRSC